MGHPGSVLEAPCGVLELLGSLPSAPGSRQERQNRCRSAAEAETVGRSAAEVRIETDLGGGPEAWRLGPRTETFI